MLTTIRIYYEQRPPSIEKTVNNVPMLGDCILLTPSEYQTILGEDGGDPRFKVVKVVYRKLIYGNTPEGEVVALVVTDA